MMAFALRCPGARSARWSALPLLTLALLLQGCATSPMHTYYYGDRSAGLQRSNLIDTNERAADALLEYAPLDAQGWDEITPVYLEFPGWSENTHGITVWDELPPAARAYLRALEELAGCPISIVSTGPDREHTMVLRDPFA